MKKQTARILCTFLCVLSLISLLPVSADAAASYSTLSSKKVAIEYPETYFSDVLVAKTTGGKKNNSIYLVPRPETGNGDMGTVKNGSNVVILAEENDYYFYMTTSGKLGWANQKYFTEPTEVEYGYLFGESGLTTDDIESIRTFLSEGDCGMASKDYYASRAVLVMKKGETKKITIHRKWAGKYTVNFWDDDVSLKWIGNNANCKLQIKAKQTGPTTLTFSNSQNDQVFYVKIIVL